MRDYHGFWIVAICLAIFLLGYLSTTTGVEPIMTFSEHDNEEYIDDPNNPELPVSSDIVTDASIARDQAIERFGNDVEKFERVMHLYLAHHFDEFMERNPDLEIVVIDWAQNQRDSYDIDQEVDP